MLDSDSWCTHTQTHTYLGHWHLHFVVVSWLPPVNGAVSIHDHILVLHKLPASTQAKNHPAVGTSKHVVALHTHRSIRPCPTGRLGCFFPSVPVVPHNNLAKTRHVPFRAAVLLRQQFPTACLPFTPHSKTNAVTLTHPAGSSTPVSQMLPSCQLRRSPLSTFQAPREAQPPTTTSC